MKVLMIDNFDSFTYNLVDEFEKRNCEVLVYRNNITIKKFDELVREFNPNLIMISPGPSTPKDAGISNEVVKRYAGKIPLFGVCLGHQCIIESLGGVVGKAKEIVHGKADIIEHDGKTIFTGIENPLSIGRYHSLAGLEIPNCLEVSSRTKDGEVMSLRHKKYDKNFVEGVQFHPESILTTLGGELIGNIIKMCEKND